VASKPTTNRRNWIVRASAAAAGVAGLLMAGIRPRFKHGFHFFGSRKQVDGKSTATAPPIDKSFAAKDAIRLFVLGDWGSGAAQQHQVAAAMAAWARREKPESIISTGDNFYPHGVASTSDPKWQEKFETVYNDPVLQLPWFAALGNHDHHGSVEAQCQYRQINPRWTLQPYYKFTRTAGALAADFFVLDTDPIVNGDHASAERQREWLEKELSVSQAHWKIVIGHHPIRSYGSYGPSAVLLSLVKPLLDRYQVHAYLCGHDHDLQVVKNPADRFTCVVSGAGGKARDTAVGPNSSFAATNGGFAYLAMSQGELYIAMIGPAAELLFSTSIAAKPLSLAA
jgi:acid phosphatase